MVEVCLVQRLLEEIKQSHHLNVCLFVLELNVPVNNFQSMSGRDEATASWLLPVLSGSKVSEYTLRKNIVLYRTFYINGRLHILSMTSARAKHVHFMT